MLKVRDGSLGGHTFSMRSLFLIKPFCFPANREISAVILCLND